MKKFLSLTLALLMSMALAAPAFAETGPSTPIDAIEENYGIMPLVVLYPSTPISVAASYRTEDFTASSANGNYIRFWFQNTTSEKVYVSLHRTDSGTDEVVKSMYVKGDSQNQAVYYNSTAGSGTYYVKIEAVASGGAISGNLSAAQYTTYPTN